jgi:hypothetical protein
MELFFSGHVYLVFKISPAHECLYCYIDLGISVTCDFIEKVSYAHSFYLSPMNSWAWPFNHVPQFLYVVFMCTHFLIICEQELDLVLHL